MEKDCAMRIKLNNYIALHDIKIIPNVTLCCGPQYEVLKRNNYKVVMIPNYYATVLKQNHLELDADCVRVGMKLMCSTHNNSIIYVFGTHWWEHEGGSFEKNAIINAWCGEGCHNVLVDTWSYRG